MSKQLSFAEVARYPRPGLAGPKNFQFAPDGQTILYLYSPEGTLVQQLWAYDVKTGERRRVTGTDAAAPTGRPLSREEELRRERGRVRDLGVTSYAYAGQAAPPALLVPLGGALYLRRGAGPLAELAGSQGALEARLSPDGAHVAFVRDGELQVLDTAGGAARTLSSGAAPGITNGLAEFVAQEEMGRQEGFWWSKDGRHLAYTRVDSREIPIYPIVHQGTDAVDIEEHRYPFAGQVNARVQLGVVPAAGGETTWMDLGGDPDIYLARVDWAPDGGLMVQIETRDQHTLRLVRLDPATGAATPLTSETAHPWINLASDTRFLESGEILWSSERTGFRHLYLRDRDGREIRVLTSGEWVVTGVVAVDEGARTVYFQATRDGVTERHLYAVGLQGGEVRRMTAEPGWHDTQVSPDFARFVDTWSSLERAPTVVLRGMDGAQEAVLYEDAGATAAALDLPVPELTTVTTRDGVTLQAAVYGPPDRAADRRYPLIVSVYGGPHAQRVANHWDLTVDLRAQYLVQTGFVVLRVDNRGSANRGLAFEAAIAGDMGNIEVQDQVDAVRALAARPYVDGTRVGIFGWSYGGYLTCMALLRAPEVFKVGVAGAPVTSWDGYDTHYTEHYMGLPARNAEGYRRSAAMSHAANLAGKLLLVHGMVDENVHFRHTARLIAALAAAQKPYDLLLFPEERHMPRDAAGLEYQERRVIVYFQEHL